MTEPTNSELDDLMHAAMPISAHFLPVQKQKVRDFARAVLIKWGTPHAVAGEPIGYLYCGGSYGDELADWEIVADQHQCDKLNEHHGSLGKEAKLPIYTTPQPTQAQAGAVPLTDERIKEVMDLVSDWGMQSHLRGEAELDAHNPEATEDEITYAKECAEKERAAWNAIKDKLKPNGIKGGQHGPA